MKGQGITTSVAKTGQNDLSTAEISDFIFWGADVNLFATSVQYGQ